MDTRIRALREYFDRGEKLDCSCCDAECCTAIMLTKEERARILSYIQKKGLKIQTTRLDKCEYLSADNQCMCYEERPIICRTFGKIMQFKNAPRMSCSYQPTKATLPIPEEMKRYRKAVNAKNRYAKIINLPI
ncbi:MAG: YkgJ family cysteine cluster protein [Candidatus Peribacteria bacterium]|jgi:Fe-S-cluster containining protein|nr:YkgJ family cysteine cluster protein [Candidatus Peribacteria bacterium]